VPQLGFQVVTFFIKTTEIRVSARDPVEMNADCPFPALQEGPPGRAAPPAIRWPDQDAARFLST
jgi:hypothetical protein